MATILTTPGLTETAVQYLQTHVDGRYDLVRLLQDGSAPHDVSDAEILIWCEWHNDALPRTLDAAPSLHWIHACTGGLDQLEHPRLDNSGVALTRSPNAAAVPVSEWALAAMLTCGKRFGWSEAMQAKRTWSPADPIELFGSTVGIVGTGAIGSSVAHRAAGLGMKVIGVNRTGRPATGFESVVAVSSMREILPQCDFLVLACPLTPESLGLIGAAEMTAMKSTAFLINVARGPVLIERDLIDAIDAGDIAGAFLDVFDTEPLPSSSPLWESAEIRITPHSAWRSAKSHLRAVDDFLQHLPRFEQGLEVVTK